MTRMGTRHRPAGKGSAVCQREFLVPVLGVVPCWRVGLLSDAVGQAVGWGSAGEGTLYRGERWGRLSFSWSWFIESHMSNIKQGGRPLVLRPLMPIR